MKANTVYLLLCCRCFLSFIPLFILYYCFFVLSRSGGKVFGKEAPPHLLTFIVLVIS